MKEDDIEKRVEEIARKYKASHGTYDKDTDLAKLWEESKLPYILFNNIVRKVLYRLLEEKENESNVD